MDKIVYLAVAGSGKTFTLCNILDKDKRNIIIAYTHQNLYNIRKELMCRFGEIPEDIYITTFHSFIYNFFILPYESYIHEIDTKGITMIEPPKASTRELFNPLYIKDDKLYHYIFKYTNQYYCGRMSKLILKCGKNKNSILIKGIKRLEKFFDNIYVDEFQDFRMSDYDLLNEIIKRVNRPCKLYGDYYQHSVSGINNSGKPFKKTPYDIFIDKLEKQGINVDNKMLSSSRRCSKNVCNFIKEKININITSSGKNEGDIFFVSDQKSIRDIINNDKIVKLVYNNSKKQRFNAINWSYSKGDTYDETCIILNGNQADLNDGKFEYKQTEIARNVFYVALTRSSGNVHLIHKKDFEKYIKSDIS